MTDYADYSSVPWKDIIGNVKIIDIQDGVAYIGDFAFYGNSSTKISIPASVTYIGESAFCGSSSQSCTVNFARPNTSQNLQTKGKPFDTGTLKYTGSGTFVLFDGDTDIEDGTSSSVFSSDNTKTFNWRSAPFNITISETEHGTVSAGVEGNTVTKAEKDKVVTLNVTPDTYYELKSITVTSPREGITEFRDLASVMGDAVFGANPNWEEDFDNYYCKIADGKFAVYSDENVIVVELSAGNVKELSYVGDQILVETNDNYLWYFKISGQAIKTITVFIGDERIFHSVNGSSTGSVAPDVLTLTTVTEGSVYTFTMPNKTVTVTAEFGKNTYADGIGLHPEIYSVSPDENIGVDFYMELAGDVINDEAAYMQFTFPDKTTKKVNISDARIEENYYVFTCEVSAKEMTDTITAQMFSGEKEGTVYTFTVKDYADYILNNSGENSDYANAVPLVSAMLNYGAYSQIYFGHNTDKLAADVSGMGSDSVTIENVNENSVKLPENVKLEGASLSLESDISLNLYFSDSTNKELTFTTDPTYALPQKQEGGLTKVTISGINAKDIGEYITVNVSVDGDENSYSVKYNPLNYCYSVVNSDSPDSLKIVVKALYLFYTAL